MGFTDGDEGAIVGTIVGFVGSTVGVADGDDGAIVGTIVGLVGMTVGVADGVSKVTENVPLQLYVL